MRPCPTRKTPPPPRGGWARDSTPVRLPPGARRVPPLLLPALLLLLPACGTDAGGSFLAEAVQASELPGTPESLDPHPGLLRAPLPAPEQVGGLLTAVRDAFAASDPSVGLSHLAAVENALPGMGDWLPLFQAELLARGGDVAGVEGALARLPPGTGILERWGTGVVIQALQESKETPDAVLAGWLHALSRQNPDDARRAGDLAGLAALLDGTDPTTARLHRIEALNTAPGSPGALEAALALAEALQDGDDPALRDWIAEELERHGRWSAAVPLRRDLLVRAGGLPAEGEARTKLGRALLESGEAAASLRTLDALPELDGPEVRAIRVEALAATGRTSASREALLALAERYPTAAPTARVLLARGAALAERDPLAARELLLLLARSGHRPWAFDATALELGLRLYEDHHFEAAASFLQAFAEAHPRGVPKQQALYWAALSLGRVGEATRRDALLHTVWELDPVSWYGTRAARAVGLPPLPLDLPEGPPPGDASLQELTAAVLRLRIHLEVPTPGSYLHELDRLTRHFLQWEDGLHTLGEAMGTGGIPLQAARFVRGLAGDPGGNWDLRLLRAAFPFPYREEIVTTAEAAGVDPFLVAGLIRQESLFLPDIRSRAGAVGLMQIMPATGQGLARQEGLRAFQTSHLEDPALNVRLGTRYLVEQLQRWDGRVTDALSAYNAGPSRIARWRSAPTYGDPDLFVERIPFAETRGYVKSVTLNWSLYAALYGCLEVRAEVCPHPEEPLFTPGTRRGVGARAADQR